MVDVHAAAPNLGVLDTIARLQLAARRQGCSIRLCNTTRALRELIELVGLSDVLLLEPEREAEGCEELRVEKVVQPGDPTV